MVGECEKQSKSKKVIWKRIMKPCKMMEYAGRLVLNQLNIANIIIIIIIIIIILAAHANLNSLLVKLVCVHCSE